MRVGVGGFGIPARLGNNGLPLELPWRVAVGIHATRDARAIHRRAGGFAGGGVGVSGWITFGVVLVILFV